MYNQGGSNWGNNLNGNPWGQQGMSRGGGMGMGHMPHESFDMEFMMPPDVNEIESDISKTVLVYDYRKHWCFDT